jgi:hypothetical protein
MAHAAAGNLDKDIMRSKVGRHSLDATELFWGD